MVPQPFFHRIFKFLIVFLFWISLYRANIFALTLWLLLACGHMFLCALFQTGLSSNFKLIFFKK